MEVICFWLAAGAIWAIDRFLGKYAHPWLMRFATALVVFAFAGALWEALHRIVR